jgi:CRP-like cAMP-binding protein|tara:strand:+ start:2316 stop:3032 length:717 start_codon:yes stop_codon:yes gene_type:complete
MVAQRQLGGNGCIDSQFMESPEWSALTESEVKILEKAVVCRKHELGDVIFYEGDACHGTYFIKSGLVGIRKADIEGDSTLLKIAQPGDTLGYRPLLAEQNHRASAEVLKPSHICFINRATVRLLMRSNPNLGLNFLKRAAIELGEFEERFHESVTLSVRARFAHLLIALQDKYGHAGEDGSLVLELPVSRADLAAMLGVRRESVSRVIHELEREGLTHFIDRSVQVPDLDSLIDEFTT